MQLVRVYRMQPGDIRNVPSSLACRPIVHVSPFVDLEYENFARRMLEIFMYSGAMLLCTRQETFQDFLFEYVCVCVNV